MSPLRSGIAAVAVVAALLTGCSDQRDYAQATAVLVDVSGTYAEQKDDVVRFIKTGILPDLMGGDTLVLITIDDLSYEESNLIAELKLDMRPSAANSQKLAFAVELEDFARSRARARHTDIRGAMMLASEHLKESGARNQNIVVFSDLEEDLPSGARRSFDEHEFDNITVLAMNVKKLGPDNRDPSRYRQRLAMWERSVLDNGGVAWQVIMSPMTLVEVLKSGRG